MAYRSMVLLRAAMAVVDFSTTKIPSWEAPDLDGKEREDIFGFDFCQPRA